MSLLLKSGLITLAVVLGFAVPIILLAVYGLAQYIVVTVAAIVLFYMLWFLTYVLLDEY